MTLGRRTATIVLLLLFATALAVYSVQRYVVYPQFLVLEREQSRQNAELVLEVITRELELLAPQVQDWAYWDDTYQFVADRNQAYIDTNLIISAQQSLDVQLLAYYDLEGKKIWSRGLDLKTLDPLDIDLIRNEHLPNGVPLLVRSDRRILRAGLIDTNLGLLFITAAPILPGSHDGPQRGTMIMGRFFEPRALRRIASQNHLALKLGKPTMPTMRRKPRPLGDIAIDASPFQYSLSSDYTGVNTQLFGLDGKPAMAIAISTPREISRRGYDALQSSLTLLVLAGVALMGLLLWALNREILEPLSQLTRIAGRIGADGDHRARLGLDRDDEIGELADEFDKMLVRLTDAQQRLLEQSYKAGASEMAGGIIGDLRKSLGPLREGLDSPLRLLDKAQASSQLMLLHQLGDSNIAHPKHAEVLQMLQDNTNEQASVLSETRAELRQLRRTLEQSLETLAEYARYLNSKTTLSSVSLSALLDHAMRMLSPQLRMVVTIEIDDSVARVGNVVAARELLQQVVCLLVNNSATAIQNTNGQQGSLRITAMPEANEDHDCIHLRFDDSRPTPSTEQMARMFSADANHETRTDGLSLPWASSVVTAMHGHLYASVSQPFGGMVTHLVLPRAKD